jgi:hypothetical protein
MKKNQPTCVVMKYNTDVKTVNEFINADNIDADPAHQRPQVPDFRKRRGIVEAMMEGYDIGEIKLNEFPVVDTVELEAIDGSNRMRSIKQFYNGIFSIFDNNVFYKDLTVSQQKIFQNYPFRFTIYDNLTPAQKAKQLITTNTVTRVNHMEMMNSFGVLNIACLVRELVRNVAGTDTVPNEVFDCTYSEKTGRMNFRFFQFNNDGLYCEDNVARIAYLCNEDKGLIPHGDALILDMYKTADFTDQEISSLRKKVTLVLNFIKQCADTRKRWFGTGPSKTEFVCLYRLYFYLTEKYGKFTIEDYDEFFKAFKTGFDAFASQSPTRVETVIDQVKGKDKTPELIGKLFNRSLLNHDSGCTKAVNWLLEEFDVLSHITVQDNKRVFSRGQIETGLSRQQFKCWIDDKPLTMKDAEGGHIQAWSKGGTTTDDNFVVISRFHNRKMGNQNAAEYKENIASDVELFEEDVE